jgi:hypothetical protein
MKRALTLVLLLASSPALADAPSGVWNAHAAAILLHAHPHAWQPPAAVVPARAGMTLTPESGAAVAPTAGDMRAAAAYRSALAKIPVEFRADGSRFARLGGLVRAYMVASVAPDGRLMQECVESQPEALARVHAGTAGATGAHEPCEDR